LHRPEARQSILDLVPKNDVVVENFAPDVIASMAFAYDILGKINPTRAAQHSLMMS